MRLEVCGSGVVLVGVCHRRVSHKDHTSRADQDVLLVWLEHKHHGCGKLLLLNAVGQRPCSYGAVTLHEKESLDMRMGMVTQDYSFLLRAEHLCFHHSWKVGRGAKGRQLTTDITVGIGHRKDYHCCSPPSTREIVAIILYHNRVKIVNYFYAIIILSEGAVTANLTNVSYVSAFAMAAILALLSGLFLLISLKIFKVEKRSYGFAYLIALANGIVNVLLNILIMGKINNVLLFIIGVLISFAIVGLAVLLKYKPGFGKTVLIWLIWAVFNFIITLLFTLVASAFAAFVTGLTGA